LGLEQELVSHIDKIQGPKDTTLQERHSREVSTTPRDPANDQRVNQELDITEEFLRESKRLREIVALKASGKTKTGRINLSKISKKRLRRSRTNTVKIQGDFNKREGINAIEISRRKEEDECLRCAWPSDRTGSHQVKDCLRQIKLTPGTAEFSKAQKKSSMPLESSGSADSSEVNG